MYTVLLPVDTSEERALAQADAAVKLTDAAGSVVVHLLHVFDDPAAARDDAVTDVEAAAVVADRLESAGGTVRPVARSGDPTTEILAAADSVGADMVLLGGRKRSALGSALFGSVSQEVTLEADRPVVVTGARTETEEPSHRCRSCGEEYFTRPGVEITTCRNCGGAKVARLDEDDETETPTVT